jgi:branched-subunit amino acid ABC-type transport system permease component
MVLADALATDLFRAVLQGGPPGTVYALIALGFVLTYKTSGVFNLAFGAQAYASAVVYYKLHIDQGWAIVPAFVVAVLLLAPAIGFVLEWLVFRHLRTAPAVAKLVVAIGLTVAIPSILGLAVHLDSSLSPEGIVPDGSTVYYSVFRTYSFSRDELASMVAATLAVVGLGLLFRLSSIGLQMRAVVESPRMAELNGVASDRVSAFAWALSSGFAGLAGVLIAPRFNVLGSGDFFNLVIVGIAAAAVARLTSLPRAAAGGLGLGVLIAVFNTLVPRWSDTVTWLRPVQDNLTPALPFVVLFGVLVVDRGIRRSREAGDPLAGVDPPPTTTALTVGAATRRGRVLGAGVLVGVLAIVLFRADVTWTYRVTQAVTLAVVLLSITVITGLAGQISLCQGSFAAIGAFATYQLAGVHGAPPMAAALAGAVIAAATAAVLALPLRRLSGIWVAIATLAFAYFFDAVMVRLSWVGGDGLSTAVVPRPAIGPWDLGDDRGFLVLALIVLGVVSLAVVQLRAGSTGLQLRALGGSQVAAQSIGISPTASRVVAFAASGFIAGLGGALMAMHQESVGYAINFTPFGALFWLVLVVTAGVGLVSGAWVAAATFALFDAVILKGAAFAWLLRSPDRIPGFLPVSQQWLFIGFGLAAVTFARHPEGSIEQTRAQLAARRQARQRRRAASAGPPPPVDAPVGDVMV